MAQPPVASPCTGICTLDPTGQRCIGCNRTLDEIASWGTMDEAERQAVVSRLARRTSVTAFRAL